MRMFTAKILRLALVFSTSVTSASAQTSACRVDPFRGATTPQGAVARMSLINRGASYSITNYGLPAERGNPADSGSITVKPSHGTAEFVAPQARYMPAPGFAGDDEFTYEAFARGANDQQLRLKVRVQIQVVAP